MKLTVRYILLFSGSILGGVTCVSLDTR